MNRKRGFKVDDKMSFKGLVCYLSRLVLVRGASINIFA